MIAIKITFYDFLFSCHDFLKNITVRTTFKFTKFINRGYLISLIHPNSNLNLAVKVTNTSLESFLLYRDIFQEKNIVNKITCNVLNTIHERHPKIFSSLDQHADQQNLHKSPSHKTTMLKKIISCFLLSLREKNDNEFDKKLRRIVMKDLHHKNQKIVFTCLSNEIKYDQGNSK